MNESQSRSINECLVSVVVICRNEERNIGEVLESLAAQSLPVERFEVIIVDNGSTDRTVQIARSFRNRFATLRIEHNPVPNIARSRNIGWKAARGLYVAFTDADCIVPPRWLELLLDSFEDHKRRGIQLGAAGGGNRPPDCRSRFMQALGVTLNSFWGSHGSTQGRRFASPRYVPHIPTLNIMYDRQVLSDLGGFDENFARVCEDPELNHRLIRRGYRILYVPEAEVVHKMRPDLRRWLRNVYLYGWGRVNIIRKHPEHFALKFLVPPVILASLCVSVSAAPWAAGALLLPAAYISAVGGISFVLGLRARAITLLPWIFLILATQPLAYGAGEIASILAPGRNLLSSGKGKNQKGLTAGPEESAEAGLQACSAEKRPASALTAEMPPDEPVPG